MVITIGGEYGCGAKKVARLAAEQLGYKLCADEIITKAVKDSDVNIKEETYKYYDESEGTASVSELQRDSRVVNVARSSFDTCVDALVADAVPLDRRISDSQRKVINAFADEGNCIILGRCADYYLEGRKGVVKVWCFNSEENCVKCIVKNWNVSEKEAAKLIKKTNKRRQDYYEYFASRKWKDSSNYDVVLNIEDLGIDGAVDVIKALATSTKIGGDNCD